MLHAYALRVARCLQSHQPLVRQRSSSPVIPRTTATFCTKTVGGGDEMEKKSQEQEQQMAKNTGDIVVDSFGEAYATRCDEEGFGGIYGRNQEDTMTTQITRPGMSRDIVVDSFGEAYATRCDEEGFGGIYGRNQEDTTTMQITRPDFDKSQGSEVMEKEKARDQ